MHTRKKLDILTRKSLKMYLTDEDDLECFSELIDDGTCASEIMLCVLTEILQKPMK